MTQIAFGYSVVASELHDDEQVHRLTEPLTRRFERLGGTEVEPDELDPSDSRPHVLLVATGGTERRLIEVVEQRTGPRADEPILLFAHGGHNSLPAALETLAALHQRDRRGRVVYLSDDETDRGRITEAVQDLDVRNRFHATRLGLIGGPSTWLVASSPSSEVVRRRWGPIIDVVDPAELTKRSLHPDESDVERLAARFEQDTPPPVVPGRASAPTVTPVDVRDAAHVAVGLADLVGDRDFDAVSVRCFDLLTDPGTSGCLGLAALNDDAVVAGCEGDLPSTLSMLWARLLLDQPAWMANPARIDVERNRVVVAHCTIAPSMTTSLSLSTHFESGSGVGIGGQLPQEPVTLIRIGGRDLDELWIAEGDIIETGDDPDLCRTQATVRLVDSDVEELLDRPLGNHLTLVAGHHRHRLERWWRFAVA